ncbi:hypothetical protein PIB30_065213 [Stylosanthes scabra]|uniref:Uncharacterized protein n=1 Tax=Stylosanthes scabra TaxID=79078 RepID=A0ABU6UKR0_9FABA|nr:hypothetical protein [Stylosanthes scabra]
MRSLGLMEGVDLPTRPIGRVWLRGLHAKHLYLRISGVYGDTRDISIHGLTSFYQFSSIFPFNLRSLTLTIATPVFLTAKIVPCVNSLGERPESYTPNHPKVSVLNATRGVPNAKLGVFNARRKLKNAQAPILHLLGAFLTPGGAFITWAIMDILEVHLK